MTAVEAIDLEGPFAWDQREADTDRAYAAFCMYRNAGPLRSLRKLVPQFYGDDTDGSTTKLRQLATWSSEGQWVARAVAYDQWMERLRTVERREAVTEMERRHAADAAKAFTFAIDALTQAAEDPEGEGISVQEATRLMDVAAKLERSARGVADVSVDMQVEHSSDMTRLVMADPEARALMLAAMEKLSRAESNSSPG